MRGPVPVPSRPAPGSARLVRSAPDAAATPSRLHPPGRGFWTFPSTAASAPGPSRLRFYSSARTQIPPRPSHPCLHPGIPSAFRPRPSVLRSLVTSSCAPAVCGPCPLSACEHPGWDFYPFSACAFLGSGLLSPLCAPPSHCLPTPLLWVPSLSLPAPLLSGVFVVISLPAHPG